MKTGLIAGLCTALVATAARADGMVDLGGGVASSADPFIRNAFVLAVLTVLAVAGLFVAGGGHPTRRRL